MKYVSFVFVCVTVPRHPDHNQVWDFDIELGNTAEEDAMDDPSVFASSNICCCCFANNEVFLC